MNIKSYKQYSNKFQNFTMYKIQSGASKKKLFRLKKNSQHYILIDFNNDKIEYNNHIRIYDILKNINISVPKIIEKNDDDLSLICEDFGDLRFDKILNDYPLKDILIYAIDTLVILNNSIDFDKGNKIPQYNFRKFESEVMEMPQYYFPYIKLNDKNLVDEFFNIWLEGFENFKFEFIYFAHKDFNINNLFFLPSKKNHLKCGVIDFQSAFWGESSWDLFSLLEDSRILFSDKYNKKFIKYFYSKINLNISFDEFLSKYYFLSSSRQTRLLGRWVKLAKEFNQKWYLDFISTTQYRLKKSILLSENKKLIRFYNRYIFK
jgi:aminoglycoside/choline kinase family phosphotransferase